MPDIDVPRGLDAEHFLRNWVDVHCRILRTVSCSCLIGAVFSIRPELKMAKIFYVAAVGWFIHLSLDCLYGVLGVLSSYRYQRPFFCPEWNVYPYASGIDAIILVGWLLHEEMHNYIIDYF